MVLQEGLLNREVVFLTSFSLRYLQCDFANAKVLSLEDWKLVVFLDALKEVVQPVSRLANFTCCHCAQLESFFAVPAPLLNIRQMYHQSFNI